jgi:hypothetical protein
MTDLKRDVLAEQGIGLGCERSSGWDRRWTWAVRSGCGGCGGGRRRRRCRVRVRRDLIHAVWRGSEGRNPRSAGEDRREGDREKEEATFASCFIHGDLRTHTELAIAVSVSFFSLSSLCVFC